MCLAVPGKVVSITGEHELRSGTVDFGGIRKQVNLAFVPNANIDDYVLVHVGFAISVVDEEEARKVLEYLEQMVELGELKELG